MENQREVSRQEFKEWLNRNAVQFRKEGYRADDVKRLALACGFSVLHVNEWHMSAKFKEAV